MKKLLLFIPLVLLAVGVQSQELALTTQRQSKGVDTATNTPIESYWLNQNLDPLNYQLVSQSISYDTRALESGLEGLVLVQIQVDENGHYFGHEVINDAHPLLVQAVEDKVQHLEFPKPEYLGEPVSALVNVPFRFRLTDGW